MARGIFSLSEVRYQQVKNLAFGNYKSWPEFGNYGYFGGGYNVSTISRIDFSNETALNPGANLPNSWFGLTKAESFNNGYFIHGQLPGTASVNDGVFKLDFSNEIVSNPGMSFGLARYAATSIETDTDAYIAGGYQPSGSIFPTSIRKFSFSTETSSSVANIPQGKEDANGLSGLNYGYFGGGTRSPGQTNTTSNIYRFDFSNSVVSSPGNLPQNITMMGGTSDPSSEYGYYTGGSLTGGPNSTNPISNTYRIDFSNETILETNRQPANNVFVRSTMNGSTSLMKGRNINNIIKFNFFNETFSLCGFDISPVSRTGCDAVSSRRRINTSRKNKSYGYYAGGRDSTPGATINTISRLDLTSETVASLTAGVSSPARYSFAASSNNYYSYFAGGFTTAAINTVSKFDFSNEITSSAKNNLPYSTYGLGSVSSSSYSYFMGGNAINTVSRLDFSTETISLPGKNLPSIRYNYGYASNSLNGYIVGGQETPSPSSTTLASKIDFYNEVLSNLGSSLTFSRTGISGVSGEDKGYFGGGAILLGGASQSQVSKLDFPTEVFGLDFNLFLSSRFGAGGVSNNFLGYFGGGYNNTIQCANFTNDTVRAVFFGLPVSVDSLSGFTNSN